MRASTAVNLLIMGALVAGTVGALHLCSVPKNVDDDPPPEDKPVPAVPMGVETASPGDPSPDPLASQVNRQSGGTFIYIPHSSASPAYAPVPSYAPSPGYQAPPRAPEGTAAARGSPQPAPKPAAAAPSARGGFGASGGGGGGG